MLAEGARGEKRGKGGRGEAEQGKDEQKKKP